MKNVIISWAIEIVYDENAYSRLKADDNQYFIFDAERDIQAVGVND